MYVQTMRQREVLYQVDFCLVMLKRSLARAGGQRTDDEAAVLHARIAELSATLDGRNAERSLFQAQIKKTEQDLGEPTSTSPPACGFLLSCYAVILVFNPLCPASQKSFVKVLMLDECRTCQKKSSRSDCTVQEFG
jgi:hypothetical protein